MPKTLRLARSASGKGASTGWGTRSTSRAMAASTAAIACWTTASGCTADGASGSSRPSPTARSSTSSRRRARSRHSSALRSSARTTALRFGQIAAAVAATMGKAKLHGLLNPEAPAAPSLNLTLVLGQIDEDELQRRYAETILLRQQRRKQIGNGGNGSALN